MLSNLRNLDSEIVSKAAAVGRYLAGGTGDNTKITGATIDRYGTSKQGYQSAQIAAAFHAVLGASATLSLALEYQDSADGSSWNTAVPLYASGIVLTDSGGGGAQTGQKTIGLNMEGLQRFVRFNPTPDLSAANTDTGEIAIVAVLGGGRVLPAD